MLGGIGTLLAILIVMVGVTKRISNRLGATAARLEVSRMAVAVAQEAANEIPMVSIVIDPNGTSVSSTVTVSE